MSSAIELEIASPVAVAQHASAELSAPVERTTALFAPFQQPFANAAELLIREPSATDATAARALRLKLVKARTEITRTKDAAKADVKLVGQVIDWYHRKGAQQCEEAEARLLEIEKAEERAIAAQKEKLRGERSAQLLAVGVDGQYFPLGEMPEPAFAQLLHSSTIAHRAKLEAEAKAKEEARIAAEKAEVERIAREKAEVEERERIRQENERLKREAEERERLAKIERERLAKEKAEAEAALAEQRKKAAEAERAAAEQSRKEREAVEAKVRAERAELEARARAEREAREKLEAEALARREAEEKRQREESERLAAAAAAPDQEKLQALAALIRTIEIPEMSSRAGRTAALTVGRLINELARQVDAISLKLGARTNGGAA